ncbi:MAG: acyl-CoA dehydrogenase C-terminal domain-containing protein, partial [bacterium]|nr:acyl-CoA dehydrogenase C-terminal domain-containing protein [bacterium]
EMVVLTVGGWVRARGWDEASRRQVAEPHRSDFWRAKQTSSRFFLDQILPKAPALAPAVTSGAAALS